MKMSAYKVSLIFFIYSDIFLLTLKPQVQSMTNIPLLRALLDRLYAKVP